MTWTPENYKTLKAWMDAKSSTIASDADKIAAEKYNAETVNGRYRDLTGLELLEALEAAEVAKIQDQAADETASSHDAAAALDYYLSVVGSVSLRPGTKTRAWIDALATGKVITTPVATLESLASEQIPRWQADGCSRPANHGDIAWVRREMKDG